MLARQFIRAEEELFNLWLNVFKPCPGRLRNIFISALFKIQISQAIIAGKPSKFMEYLNKDRLETNLPPFVRIIQIEGEMRALFRIAKSNWNVNSEMYLTRLFSNSGTRLTIKAKHEGAAELLKSLEGLAKMRSSGGKEASSLKDRSLLPLIAGRITPWRFNPSDTWRSVLTTPAAPVIDFD